MHAAPRAAGPANSRLLTPARSTTLAPRKAARASGLGAPPTPTTEPWPTGTIVWPVAGHMVRSSDSFERIADCLAIPVSNPQKFLDIVYL